MARRLFRKAVQQGRSKRRGESYSLPYVEPQSAARTPLADFVNSLLIKFAAWRWTADAFDSEKAEVKVDAIKFSVVSFPAHHAGSFII